MKENWPIILLGVAILLVIALALPFIGAIPG